MLLLARRLDAYGASRLAALSAEPFDAIVVAGCRVRPDGQASESLRRRAAHAARLWREGRAPRVVATGGSIAGRRSEAAAAADVLREHGVSTGAIVLESRSTTTRQNAEETAKLVRGRVLVVTDSFHVHRCELLFGAHFDEARGVGVRGPWRARLKGSLRESLAMAARWSGWRR